MKVRSCLLVVCMLAVPAAAMFSHRVPVPLRRACWGAIAGPIEDACSWVQSCLTTPAASVEPATPASQPPGVRVPPPEAVAPPASVAAVGDPLSAPVAASEPDVVALELTALGATSIECRPLAGAGDAHVASCHVAIDATGQLLRVFQAVGLERRSALHALLDDVAAWRRGDPSATRGEAIGHRAGDRRR